MFRKVCLVDFGDGEHRIAQMVVTVESRLWRLLYEGGIKETFICMIQLP